LHVCEERSQGFLGRIWVFGLLGGLFGDFAVSMWKGLASISFCLFRDLILVSLIVHLSFLLPRIFLFVSLLVPLGSDKFHQVTLLHTGVLYLQSRCVLFTEQDV